MPSEKRVLVAEEDPVCRRFVELSLRCGGFNVIAGDPEEARRALDQYGSDAFECLVSCYNHAQDGGLDLVDWVRQQDATLATVVLASMQDSHMVEKSLRGRSCDFLEKPLSVPTLSQAVNNAVATTGQRRGLSYLTQGVQAAGLVQKTLLSSVLSSSDTPIESYFRPKQQAGGDFLAHYRTSGGDDILIMTDVSGHDLEAAVMSAMFHGMARGLIDSGVTIEEVLTRYNQVLLTTPGFEARPSSIAVCCIRLSYTSKSMQIFLAGAPPPRWVNATGWLDSSTHVFSTPLGWFEHARPAVLLTDLPSTPVLFWTDGVEDLAGQLGADPMSVASALIAAGRTGVDPDWIDEAHDDILVARVWAGVRYSDTAMQETPVVSARYGRLQAAQIDALQALWARSLDLAVADLADSMRFDVLLCSREAVLNAIIHGCSETEEASLQIDWLPLSREIRVRVADPGPGYDAEAVALANQGLEDGHRGIILMKSLASTIEITQRGARVTMTFREREETYDVH